MHFDIRTLLVAVAMVTAFCAGARVLLWRMHPGMPGLGLWAWASGLGALALILIASGGAAPEPPLLAVAQLLIVAGLVLVWDGFRRFVGRAPVSWPVQAAFAVGVLIAMAIAHVEQSLAMRASVNGALIALLSSLIARDLLDDTPPDRLAMRATGWLYVVNAAFFLVRTVAVTIAEANGPKVVSAWNPDGFAALPLLWWLCMTVALTLGLVLMAGERLQKELDRQANRDPLTGALNRRAFSLVAEKEVARSRRSGQPLSLLMLDLDRFKQINDRIGHGGGDDILCRFIAAASRVLRSEDVLCRFGGEEFVALLPGTSAERALAAAERLRAVYAEKAEAAAAAYATLPLPFAITVSVGISELQRGEGIDSAIRRADAALYEAKANGRNRCELAVAGLGATTSDEVMA